MNGSRRVRTRLGKFGPEASVRIPLVIVRPRMPNGIVRHTESGIPVSARRDAVIKKAREIAARYRAAVEAGEASPSPKRKH